MRKFFLGFRRSLLAGFIVAGAGLMFTACKKNNDGYADIPSAGVMSFNLAPDQQSVVVALSGNALTRYPLGYSNFSGTYQPIYVGTRTVQSFDYPANDPLATVDYNFEQDKYYSIFVVGSDDKYRNVVTADNFDSLSATSGKAYVRFINGIIDSVNTPDVTITSGGSSVVNQNAAYAGVSQFTAVNPGEISIAVKNGSGIDASRTINVEQKKVYTILLSGVPGATNDDTKVQIRFVQNGLLTDESGSK